MQLPALLNVESAYRTAILEAERDFVRRLVADIRSDALGGTVVWRRIYELREQGVTLEEMFTNPHQYFDAEAAAWLGPPRTSSKKEPDMT